MATGTGKTMVAAFDYQKQIKQGDKKLLFLAHRKEILDQSLHTFRNVLKDQNFGELWVGGHRPEDKTHVFASIQTLNSSDNYKSFDPDYFDYIVIDESHHASASSYLEIIKYFKPEILLGLTATPERMDGENILDYFNGRIASEIRLTDAIDRKLLSPFHYFGVTDSESLDHLKWTRGGYEISEIENVYTKSKQRVEVIIGAMDRYLTDMETFKALGFCVSIKHADFMANSFNSAGIPSVALHSEASQEERSRAKSKLQAGEINCIFVVDLFNEGVDIPDIDTVLFLRPTQSLTIFIQQLGRGLRLSEDKEALTVLDFVGQAHANYDFSFKLRALTGKTRRGIKDEINDDFPNMPAGCHIKLEKIAKNYILNNIQSSIFNVRDLRTMMKNFGHNFVSDLTLENFLGNYGIEKDRFYSRYSFYKLLTETGFKKEYEVKDSKQVRQALRRFSKIDSKRLLYFAKDLLTSERDLTLLSPKEERVLGVIHYTIWGDKPEVSYASYTTEQIMVAFGKTTETYKYPFMA